jgi:RNA polymerase sigma factor (sigma-70 family)
VVEQQLIDSIKKHEPEAFKRMYESCIHYVYSIVKRYVQNESDHQDVIQEIFARVFMSVGSYDSKKGEFKYWLRKLTINQCFQHTRKHKAQGMTIEINSVTENEVGFDHIRINLTREEIEQHLKNMPEGYKQVFMLIIIDEFNHNEVGEFLGISAEASRSQLSRAKSWLRKNLFHNEQTKLINGI